MKVVSPSKQGGGKEVEVVVGLGLGTRTKKTRR